MNLTAVGILAVVFLLIMIRRVGKVRLPIWGIMTAGAILCLVLQTISPASALAAIETDVLIFLFGMFVFGAALNKSGLLQGLVMKGFSNAKTKQGVVWIFMGITAAASAIFMNDTVAVIATPVALFCAKEFGIPTVRMLLALCFSVTFGSAMTPIGNPQNLLIALSGIPDAFVLFGVYLVVPSLLCLAAAGFLLTRGLEGEISPIHEAGTTDPRLSLVCTCSFVGICLAVLARILCSFAGVEVSFVWIAIIAALPILLFSRRRLVVLKTVDYSTLVFFAAMFIVMEAVWESGVLQVLLPETLTASVPLMILSGTLVSQFVSNVPFVLMVLPLLEAAGASTALYMAASAGCTAAGCLTILGAASTIIVITAAEKEGESLSFLTYLKWGIPITALAVLIYTGWIMGIACIW